MKKMTKKLRRYIGFVIAYSLFKALGSSYRYNFINRATREKAERVTPSGSYAFAVWHEHLLSVTLAHTFHRIGMLISPSYLGDCIAWVVEKCGYRTFRGSSSRRGKEALQEFYGAYHDGWRIGVTVDGPKGPRHQVRPGVVVIASKTGIPIVPLIGFSEKNWVLEQTWDKFRIPRPFSTIHIAYGEPIMVPKNITDEQFAEYLVKVKEAVVQLEKDATKYVADGAKYPWVAATNPDGLK